MGCIDQAQRGKTNEVMRMWRMAADKEHAKAQYNLGALYSQGHGVKTNAAGSVRYIWIAAKHGDAAAQINLGGLNACGSPMFTENWRKALW